MESLLGKGFYEDGLSIHVVVLIAYAKQTGLNTSRKAAFMALFTALSIATNYLMFPLWNVKLMDSLVFVSGYCLGMIGGVVVAILVWAVYGVLNPLGFSLFILLTVAPAEMIYGLMGGLVGRRRSKNIFSNPNIKGFNLSFGVIGLLSTFIYDVITNAVSGITFTNTLWPGIFVGLLTMNFPLPMGIIHEVSNFFLFAFLAPIIISRVDRVFVNHYPTFTQKGVKG